jgi:hypothetical protein
MALRRPLRPRRPIPSQECGTVYDAPPQHGCQLSINVFVSLKEPIRVVDLGPEVGRCLQALLRSDSQLEVSVSSDVDSTIGANEPIIRANSLPLLCWLRGQPDIVRIQPFIDLHQECFGDEWIVREVPAVSISCLSENTALGYALMAASAIALATLSCSKVRDFSGTFSAQDEVEPGWLLNQLRVSKPGLEASNRFVYPLARLHASLSRGNQL